MQEGRKGKKNVSVGGKESKMGQKKGEARGEEKKMKKKTNKRNNSANGTDVKQEEGKKRE